MRMFAYALGIAIGVLAFAAAIVAPAASRNAPLDRTVPAAGVVDRAMVKVKRIAAADGHAVAQDNAEGLAKKAGSRQAAAPSEIGPAQRD
jgi:hypothetical protein